MTSALFSAPFRFMTPSLVGLMTLSSITLATAQANQTDTEAYTLPRYQLDVIVFQTLALKGWTEEVWPEDLEFIELPMTRAEKILELEELKRQQTELMAAEHQASLELSSEEASTTDVPPSTQANTKTSEAITDEDELSADLTPIVDPEELKANIRALQADLSIVNYQNPISLKIEQGLLQTEASLMTPQKGYQILLHKHWEITGYPKKMARPVGLFYQSNSAYGSQLEGKMTFYKSRYAHVDFELELDRAIPKRVRESFAQQQNLSLDTLPKTWRFQLKESRKIKSGELHYFDHPIFGVLVKMQYIKGSMRKLTPAESANQKR